MPAGSLSLSRICAPPVELHDGLLELCARRRRSSCPRWPTAELLLWQRRARGINGRGPCRGEVGLGEDVADARSFAESSGSVSSRYLSVAGGIRRYGGFSAILVLEDGVAEPSPYPLWC